MFTVLSVTDKNVLMYIGLFVTDKDVLQLIALFVIDFFDLILGVF